MTAVVRLLGSSPYTPVHTLQERLVDLRRAGCIPDVLLLLEHEETITVGRRPEGLDGVITPGQVPVVQIERGGYATWHGPGQLVAYPIVALDGPRRDVRAHLRRMEDGVIALLADLGVRAGRDERNTGVWIDGLKVCSMGIAVRQWVTWHGLALNIDADPAGFARLRPCGFGAEVMTRLADHPATASATVASLVMPLAAALHAALSLDGELEHHEAVIAAEEDVDALLDRLVR